MKIIIDGLTEKMVDALCGKWGYPETVKGEKKIKVEIQDPDPEAEEGDMIMVPKMVPAAVPNPQSKMDFVKEYVIGFVTNEYRLVVREKEKLESEQKAENQVKEEVNLT